MQLAGICRFGDLSWRAHLLSGILDWRRQQPATQEQWSSTVKTLSVATITSMMGISPAFAHAQPLFHIHDYTIVALGVAAFVIMSFFAFRKGSERNR
jgi:hypothetical protein